MNKKSNKKSKDYSDVQLLNTVINSSLRTENHDLWKTQLSGVFDVPVFLKWLAANTVMQNWDTYGITFHNYYLYNNPSTNKLVWIPWDNNEAFQKGKMGGAPKIWLNEVGENWPLIVNILDDEMWQAEYKWNVAEFSEKLFNPERMNKIYTNYQQMLSAYTIGEHREISKYSFLENESDFYAAINFLKQQVIDRERAVQEFLNE